MSAPTEDSGSDPLMEADEAAEYLKLAEGTVRNMAARGELPKVKIGRRLLFRRSSLNRWISEREEGGKK